MATPPARMLTDVLSQTVNIGSPNHKHKEYLMFKVAVGIALGMALRPFAETTYKTVKTMIDNAKEQMKKDQDAEEAEGPKTEAPETER